MTSGHELWRFPGALLCSLALLGCGRVSRSEHEPSQTGGNGGAAVDDPAPGDSGASGEATDGGAADVTGDPGLVRMRLLTGAQYRNSVADLLGVDWPPPPAPNVYPSDAAQIDDLAPYLDVATAVAEQVFAEPALPALLSCDTGTSDRDCALQVIAKLGARIYRRPLLAEQTAAFAKLYDSVIAGGETHRVALTQIVRGLLVSLQFLYRVEFTSGSASDARKPLDSYALATRLSYLLWDTTPDAELAGAANDDLLATVEGQDTEFDRLAGASHSRALGLALGSSWLGIDRLSQLGTPLALSMQQEVGAYLGAFFDDGTALTRLPSRDVNYVDSVLSPYYDPTPWADGFEQVAISTDHRTGLLGLGGVMVLMSFPDRVSISHRGQYVQTRLLCNQAYAPPGGHAAPPTRKRSDLVAATSSGACQACHGAIDPIGFGLDHFDEQGDYLVTYPDATPIDASGTLPSGSAFDGEIELAQAIERDPDFARCVATQLTEYSLGRSLVDDDSRYTVPLGGGVGSGASLRNTLRALTHTSAFRYRGAEPR